MKPSSKYISKEIFIIVFTIILTLLVTIFTTISGARFDISRLTLAEVYTNILINTVIVLVMTLVSYPYGKLNTMCKKTPDGKNGRYLNAFACFNAAYNLIQHRLYQFNQWHTKKYKQEVKDKQLRYLAEKGIKQPELILKLDRNQIKNLTTAQSYEIDGDTVYFSSLTKKQLKACLKVYDGKISVHKLPDYYFLYVDGKSSSSFYDQAYYENRVENAYVISLMSLKVATSLITACVLTSLIFEDIAFGNVLKILSNLASRILTIGLSIYSGYSIGQNLIYKKCYYIEGKTQILTEFNDDKDFEYLDPQTLAKQEYLEERGEDFAT